MDDAGRGPWDDVPRGLGVVLDEDRGNLPYVLIHGEALVACAAWALGEAGVDLVDATVSWQGIVESGEDLVLHDALCPMTPPDFLADCVRRAVAEDAVVAGVLPVTDTVKDVVERAGVTLVASTHDRERLRRLASPLVLPASVVARLDDWPDEDLLRAVADLRSRTSVLFVDAPASATRVTSAADVARLEALTSREGPPPPGSRRRPSA